MIWTPILVLIEHKSIATIRKLHLVSFQDITQTVQKKKKKLHVVYIEYIALINAELTLSQKTENMTTNPSPWGYE